ncbi:MAG: YceI family protein [Actinomyces urogenitalis]|jgi:polyisoprenoid-binding protein YceI|uniref:YceI-like domain protein n=3 Tax=Actinomyces urogenitalis TaxID=103621 RepID=C0W476_9ACTO|nr:YceI family protein [Actinomyces urogenitalis]ETJ07256.1 MAG: YceI family protein [Actinomyces urogenitalis DORA_12]EEH66458.1 YceI-like domain protein [Actinomyces urogenitalis DSM 15434]KGE98883.1 polyisoprenoid-binding protein [Actinomyces urogenitalis S6-C4]MBS5976905.1 YceI family protein [Actinomyces urogenitalis]MBS6072059.1 YceI family protein [Actinomyces urogenitalis]
MTTYVIDADHSTLGFTIRHAGIGKTRGQFDEFNGTIEVADDSTPTGSTASATIKAASVNTRNNDRDNHLRSADFFDVETYPEWTFATTGVSGSKESFTLTGDLTIHGVTKSVDLEVEFLGAATDPFGNDRAAFEASTVISRKDFGLTWNAALEAGGVLVGDKVTITLEIEAIKQA